jgi:FtsP/CotA-like multicopper oxidase with cupredoxin domain
MRMDVAVRCNSSGYYSFESQPNAPYHAELAKTTAVFAGPIFGIKVSGAAVVMDVPRNLPARPAYLPDLTRPASSQSTAIPPENKLDLTFETKGGPFGYGPPYPPMHINGASFSDKDHFIHNMTLGEIQEWTVGIAGDSNVGAGNHPFHVHVNPFQIVAIGGSTTESLGVKIGEYRDTIPLSQSLGQYRLRFVPGRFAGRALIHCHMIPHVDLGMAAVTQIVANA